MPEPKHDQPTGTGAETPQTARSAREHAPVSFVRAGHRWSFRCEVGRESDLRASLMRLADRADCEFERSDAELVMAQFDRGLPPGVHHQPR